MKNIIIGIIIGGIVFTLGGVVATTAISSTNVTYQNKTVNTALDELYDKAITGKELVAAAITNKGITTTSTDTYETMAANINSIDNNHTEINQKINNLESKHNSDITSLTGSINNLNQSLTSWNELDVTNKENGIKCIRYFNGMGLNYFSIYVENLSVELGTSTQFATIGSLGFEIVVPVIKQIVITDNILGVFKIDTNGLIQIGYTKTGDGKPINLNKGIDIFIDEVVIFQKRS